MKRVFAIAAIVASALSVAACGDSPEPGGADLNGKGTSESNPASVPVQYLQLPDGRVLECIVTRMSYGYPATDCNWDHPVNEPTPVPTPSVTQ